MLCGFGIYMGRFLRWNSWDALTHPLRFARTIVRHFLNENAYPRPIPVTLVFGGGLIVGYIVLHVLTMAPRNADSKTK